MIKQFAVLQQIDGEHPITHESDPEFLHQLQKGLLLALQEQGALNATQYRRAEERLQRQQRNSTRDRWQPGDST